MYLPFASGWICIIAVTQHYATLYRLPQIERAGGILSPKGFAAFIHTCAMPALISAVAIGLITFADARLRDAVTTLPVRIAGEDMPSAIAHGLMNAIYEHAPLNEGYHWIAYAAWGVLAFVLFRFWPPQVETTADVRRTPDDELQGRGGVVESPA